MPDDTKPDVIPTAMVNDGGATQLAQVADSPVLRIGHAETLTGDVAVIHTDGSRESLTTGEAVFAGDTIETGANGDVGIVFEDESLISIGPEGSLILDEAVYDPEGPSGNMAITITEGMFSYISGAIAKTDPEAMVLSTPVSEIGIRGTQVVGHVRPAGEETSVSLMAEPDGTVGEVVIRNDAGVQVLNQEGQTIAMQSFSEPPPPPVIVAREDILQQFAPALHALPDRAQPNDLPPQADQAGDEVAPEDAGDEAVEAAAEEAPAEDGEPDGESVEAQTEEDLPPEEELVPEEELAPEGDPALEEAMLAAAEDAQAGDADAFVQAMVEAGAFDGDAEAIAAAEEAFAQALADGATLDQAMQSAYEAGSALVTTQDGAVEEISLSEDEVTVDSMQSTTDSGGDNLFSGDTSGGSFGGSSTEDAQLVPPPSEDTLAPPPDSEPEPETMLAPPPPPPPPPPAEETPPPPPPVTTTATLAPAAISGNLFIPAGLSDGGSLRAVDGDSSPGQLSYSLAGAATNGTVTVTSTGTYTYQATTGYSGADSFTFRVTDEAGNTSTATVNVTVQPTVALSGNEYAANTTTAGTQENGSVAGFSDGTYVVVFRDANNQNILAQRFNADGISMGPETQVNTTTGGLRWSVDAVSTLSDDNFVVVWHADQGGTFDIFMQRFTRTGTPVGSETQVNTTATDSQINPTVAGLTGGGFAVIWQSNLQDGSLNGIYAQRYDSTSTAVGGEFLVNTTTAGEQVNATIAALSNGGFVIAWEDQVNDSASYGVYQQVYDSSGVAVGGETLVNSTSTANQFWPDVASLEAGGFVTVWQSTHADTGDIYGQQYDASGTAVGGEFLVNTTTTGLQERASVTGLEDGGFVVVWESPDATLDGIFGQRYDAAGTVVGSEFQINNFTSADEWNASVTALPDGGFAVVWQNSDGDGASDMGIRTRIYYVGANSAVNETGTAGDDVYFGSTVNDTISGGLGNDELLGGAGNDVLSGGAGNDTLEGGPGNDTLYGDTGNDVLIAGAGSSAATGGAGADTFFFTESSGYVSITDFEKGLDKIKIDQTSIDGGSVTFDIIATTYDGTNAGNASANFIQDASDNLYHDDNGSAAGGYTLIGNLNGVDLDSTDFEVG